MYKEGTLRPPTSRELRQKYVPLERINVEWYPTCWDDSQCSHTTHKGLPLTIGRADAVNICPSISDLVEMCQQYGIPTSAVIVPNGYEGEIALDWSL